MSSKTRLYSKTDFFLKETKVLSIILELTKDSALPLNTNKKLYRARIFNKHSSKQLFDKDTYTILEMEAPPADKALCGRANPDGIYYRSALEKGFKEALGMSPNKIMDMIKELFETAFKDHKVIIIIYCFSSEKDVQCL